MVSEVRSMVLSCSVYGVPSLWTGSVPSATIRCNRVSLVTGSVPKSAQLLQTTSSGLVDFT